MTRAAEQATLARADEIRRAERDRVLGIRTADHEILDQRLQSLLVEHRGRMRRRPDSSSVHVDRWQMQTLIDAYENAHPGRLDKAERQQHANRQGMR